MKKILKHLIYSILIVFIIQLLRLRSNQFFSKRTEQLLQNILKLMKDKQELAFILLEKTKPFKIKNEGKTEIHTVICHRDITQYILGLKSLLFFSDLNIPVVVHDDGSCTEQDFIKLRYHFPGIKIFEYKSSTKKIKRSKVLDKFPNLKEQRFNNSWNKFHILIMLDCPFFAKSEKIIYFDSDILFYRKPKELLDWIFNSKDKNGTMYMMDHMSAYALSEMQIETFYKKKIIPHFNSGLRCFWKKSFNLKEMNKMIKILGLLNNHLLWRDQTYALIDTLLHYKRVTSFSRNYTISLKPDVSESTVCFHYITPVRDKLYVDGVRLLTTKMKDVFFFSN